MFKFSAARGIPDTKTYYKGFVAEAVELEDLPNFLKRFSISSYLYTDGVTTNGEQCEGHRAGASVVGAGNVLLFDFDSKHTPVTLEMLYQRLKGCHGYIGPSKNWSQEVEKYHAVIQLDRELPMDKHDFKTLYRAVAQYLDIEGLYDPAQESWVQQLAPHFRTACPELELKGDAVNADEVLAAYIPDDVVKESEGRGVAGFVEDTAVFTLSGTGQELTVPEMIAYVQEHNKVRTHCVAGIEHDNRKDTAFVALGDDGEVYYTCQGGRCQHTKKLPQFGFAPVEVDQEVEIREEKPLTPFEIIESHPVFSKALEPKAPVRDLEGAINHVLSIQTQNYAKVEGLIRSFNGVFWDISFSCEAKIYHLVEQTMESIGLNVFVMMAKSHSATENSYKYFVKNIAERSDRLKGNYLNLQNGVLNITESGIDLLPHHEDYLFTSVLPYGYDPDAVCPTWETVVDRVMCHDKDLIEAFQQAMGYLFLRDKNFEKMIGFVGEGENGKSTVMEVMKNLVGELGYSEESIKTLLKDDNTGDYRRANLAGRLFNVTNELTPETIIADSFKALISGEGVIGRQIYGSPFPIDPAPKHVCSMNTTKALMRERTHGFERRIHLIPFNYTLKEEHKDPDLKTKLKSELSGILNWCLEGAKTVLKTNRLAVSDSMRSLFEEVKRDSNPVQQFVEERLEVLNGVIDYDNAHEVISGKEIHQVYREYCLENGYKPLGKNSFLKEIRRQLITDIHTTVSKSGRVTKSVRGFHVKILADSEVFSPTNSGGFNETGDPF